jgi:hypothetical protein
VSETWRPLGIEADEQVSTYDALHEGVPAWMDAPYWAWVRDSVTMIRSYADGSGRIPMLDCDLAEAMCQTLRIPLPNLRLELGRDNGSRQLRATIDALRSHSSPLQAADYLLAHGGHADPEQLGDLLARSKSAYGVGRRSGHPGLVRRVPLGVQIAADSVMTRTGRSGVRLAQAWEELYGLTPNSSEAYRLAIKAVEDAAIPIVAPTSTLATLGTVLAQIESQGDWGLPMTREHPRAPSSDVLASAIRLLWHGQHDRHGGQPSAPGDVSFAEAQVALSLAVILVDWFSAGLASRQGR